MAIVPFQNDEIQELISKYEVQARRFESLGNVNAFQKQRRMIMLLKEVLEFRRTMNSFDGQAFMQGKEEGVGMLGLLALAFNTKRVIFERE